MTTMACDPRLGTYFERVRDIVRSRLSPAACVRRVGEEAARLTAEALELDEDLHRLPSEGYGRHLLYEDPETGFVVIAMVWPAGHEGEAHDHGTWGVVACAEGSVEIVDYEREDDGSDALRAKLIEVGRVRAAPGAVAQVLPPHRDFHRVRNASPTELAVTIHTYGRAIERCHVVDEHGKVSLVAPTYTNASPDEGNRADGEQDILRRIVDEHELVDDSMQQIRSFAASLRMQSTPQDWDRLERMLVDFRALLAHHFEVEERDEFFGSAAALDSQSRAMIARLATQHRAFLAQIDGILADLDPLKREGRRLNFVAGELDNLGSNLRWHDAVETGFLNRLRARRPGAAER